jgi:hypothetical protein
MSKSRFASRNRDTVVLGDDSFEIAKLAGGTLKKARENRAITAMRITAAAGRQALQEARQEALAAQQKDGEVKKPVVDPRARHDEYDRETIIIAGVKSWAGSGVSDERGEPIAVTPDSVMDLDDETQDELFHRILDLSLPPLDPQVAEGQQVKG